jgi:hypothetical protein
VLSIQKQQQQYHFAGPMTNIPTDFVYVLLEQRVPVAQAPFPQFADVGVYECINVVVVPLYTLYVSLLSVRIVFTLQYRFILSACTQYKLTRAVIIYNISDCLNDWAYTLGGAAFIYVHCLHAVYGNCLGCYRK